MRVWARVAITKEKLENFEKIISLDSNLNSTKSFEQDLSLIPLKYIYRKKVDSGHPNLKSFSGV